MKFTDFEVLRIGNTVVFSCFTDSPGTGSKLQISMESESAELYEQMFEHLIKCATLYEYMPEDVLDGSLQLTKGKDS